MSSHILLRQSRPPPIIWAPAGGLRNRTARSYRTPCICTTRTINITAAPKKYFLYFTLQIISVSINVYIKYVLSLPCVLYFPSRMLHPANPFYLYLCFPPCELYFPYSNSPPYLLYFPTPTLDPFSCIPIHIFHSVSRIFPILRPHQVSSLPLSVFLSVYSPL